MRLPQPVLDLLRLYALRFPIPTINGGEDQDDYEERARQWSIRFAEQVAFTYPDQGYGVKMAGLGRPIGKDTLAQNRPDGLVAWDLLIGAGTGRPRIADEPKAHYGEEMKDQVFVPVTPTNHLGAVVPPPPDPVPVPPAPTVDLAPMLAELKTIRAEQQMLRAIVADLYNRPTPKPPAYVGTVRLWGGPSRFTPEEA